MKLLYAARNTVIVRSAQATYASLQVRNADRDEPFENLSATCIVFWNDGQKTIRGAELTDGKPLEIEVLRASDLYGVEVELIGANIAQVTDPDSNVTCNVDRKNNTIAIHFDQLTGRNGFVVELMHTGVSEKSVLVRGRVARWLPRAAPVVDEGPAGAKPRRTWALYGIAMMLVGGLVAIFARSLAPNLHPFLFFLSMLGLLSITPIAIWTGHRGGMPRELTYFHRH